MTDEDVCGAAIVDENPADIISDKVHGVLADVGMNDEEIIMGVMLKPEVGFGECNWNMGPRGAKVLAFAHM